MFCASARRYCGEARGDSQVMTIAARPIFVTAVLGVLAVLLGVDDHSARAAANNANAPAKVLFGAKARPADMTPRAIGFYSRGCLAGAVALPIDGPTWQVMRLSRNRNWGHPALIRLLERLAKQAPSLGWPGLLVGDLAQPRGGPMLTGHASHQIGLDADVWLTPMPDHVLSRQEREDLAATSVVASDWNDIDPSVWTPRHVAIIRAAAQAPEVERVLVNAAIKKALCRDARGDRSWLSKFVPIGVTTITCTSASAARQAVPAASRKARRRAATDAARNWTGGSPMRRVSRRRSPRNRSRRCALPISLTPAARS
jgi:penicillin-insensitive murein endopeptidase